MDSLKKVKNRMFVKGLQGKGFNCIFWILYSTAKIGNYQCHHPLPTFVMTLYTKKGSKYDFEFTFLLKLKQQFVNNFSWATIKSI